MNQTETKLRELLKKCSKTELIEIAVEFSKYSVWTCRTPIETVILKRIDTIDKKIDENMARSKVLSEKYKAIPGNERTVGNDYARNLMIEQNNNTLEYLKLSKQRSKLDEELFKEGLNYSQNID